MWKFGHEAWCNLKGRYVTIEADLSHLAGQTSTEAPNGYEMSICSLGLFGTRYKRLTEVPSSFEVLKGATKTLSIERVAADEKFKITNKIDINLRQKAGTELPWVTFTQTSPTKVHF